MTSRCRCRALGACAAVALTVATGGCMELVRRPGADGSPRWEAAADTLARPTPPGSAAGPGAGGAVERGGPPPGPVSAAGRRAPAPEPSGSARERVRRVNEYALWCLEHELWDEARLHLERAVARDSLAASLHNNLAIVYEKQGRPEQALAAYERAWELRPKEHYRQNLQLLRRRLEPPEEPAVPDSLLLEHEEVSPNPGTRRRPAEPDSASAP